MLLYMILAAFAVVYNIPVYVLLVTGLKSYAEVSLSTMWNMPSSLSLDSFVKAWGGEPAAEGYGGLGQNSANSLYLTIPATITSAMIGSINGYLLTKWEFRGSDILFIFLLFGTFIPNQSILIPLMRVLSAVRLSGTIPGLTACHVIYGISITTLIFRNYYASVPTELVESSRIDGANTFSIYWYVLFPLSLPGFVVVMIWQLTQIWNDFFFDCSVIGNPDLQPITVALNNLAGSMIVDWNAQMAGALIAAIPTLPVYILLGRYCVRGLMAGPLKG